MKLIDSIKPMNLDSCVGYFQLLCRLIELILHMKGGKKREREMDLNWYRKYTTNYLT